MIKYFKKNKYYLLLFIIFLILLSFSKKFDDNLSLEFTLDKNLKSLATGQIFYDTGSGYSQENYSSSDVYTKKCKIRINTNWLIQSQNLRLDPINYNSSFAIEKITVSSGFFNIWSSNALELENNLIIGNNISSISVTPNNSLEIIANGNDPYLFFSADALTQMKVSTERYVFIVKIVVGFLALFLFIIVSNGILNKIIFKIKHFFNLEHKYIVFLLFFIPATLLYWRYLIGGRLFLFIDIASDSYFQTFPTMQFNAQYIQNYLRLPTWSFSNGLGVNSFLFVMDPFNLLNTLIGSDHIAYLIGFMQFLKVILAGILFYAFIRETKISKHASAIAAIGYAFCSSVIIRGPWLIYSDEVLFVALLLLGFELFYNKKSLLVLPISIAMLFITLPGYHFFLYSGILFCYAFFRYISENKFEFIIFRKLFLRLSGLYLCGTAMSAVYLIPYLFKEFSSDRASTISFNILDIIRNIFSVHSKEMLISTYLHTIAPAGGVPVINMLEEPMFYCGIISLLMIPQLFEHMNLKKKICYGIALSIVVAYMISPGVVSIANGTISTQNKISSFWVIVVLLFLSSKALDIVFLSRKVNFKLLLCTGLLLGLPAILLILNDYQAIKKRSILMVLIFIMIYIVCFLNIKKSSKNVKNFILLFTMLEAVCLSYSNVNFRQNVNQEFIDGTYNGTSNAIVTDIKNIDMSDFYRISKTYTDVFYCDSMYQNYFGTMSYNGGGGHSVELIDFISLLDMPMLLGNNHYINGFNGYTEINTFVGTKYILSGNNHTLEYGYEKLKDYGDCSLWINKYPLPLGFAYDSYITEDEFSQLTGEEKRKLLLNACITADEDTSLIKFDVDDFLLKNEVSKKGETILQLENYENQSELVFNQSYFDKTLNISFQVEGNTSSYDLAKLNVYYMDGSSNTIEFPITLLNSQFSFDIPDADVAKIQIVSTQTDTIQIKNLNITILDSEDYYKNYKDSIMKLNESAYQITSFEQDHIKGDINLDKNEMVIFTIPYDKGWQIEVDGKKEYLKAVNIGFSGVELEKGTHSIELKYVPPMLYESIAITVIGCVSFIILIVMTIKAKKKVAKKQR